MASDLAKLTDLAPGKAAQVLIQTADQEWLSEFSWSLDRYRAHDDLDRILAVWSLSQSDAARLFQVTRQAIAKWRAHGVPQRQIAAVAELAAATDLLIRHLKRERIPAVVRRPSARLEGQSLLDLVATGRTREVLVACREMFRFGDAHA